MRIVVIVNVPPAIRIPRNIKPVPRPPLSVVRGRQQRVDSSFPRVRGSVFDEGFHFIGRRQEPDQVQVGSSKQCAAVCLRSWFESLSLECLLYKAVDGVRCPPPAGDFGNGMPNGLAKGPP